MSVRRDRWPTVVGLLGGVALLFGLGLGRQPSEVTWTADSFLGLDLAAWTVATTFLVVFLVVQILRNTRSALERERRLIETAAALRESGEELERLARLDPLTEVLNRRAFFAQLGTEFRRSRRYGRPLTAMMLDLDHFKSLNDRYGHAVGDTVLAACAAAIAANLRESDVVGRYGGEEFAVLLPETELSDGLIVAEKLRRVVEEIDIASPDGGKERLSVTISGGVATVDPNVTADGQALLNDADRALYEAKRLGRNRVAAADASALGASELAAS